jgi:glycosyltransferase involved in cell wall biosynthesis
MSSPRKEQLKASVIVAVYNQERFIGRCLRSLIHQNLSHMEYEIIVVNDGSTDRTAYALSQFCDPQDSLVKVLTNKGNQGLPAALNKGIRSARAPFIVRVDSDDFVNVNFLNVLLAYLQANKKADAVACDYLVLDDRETVLSRENCQKKPIACGIMFRKTQLMKIGLHDEEFLLHEERELRIRFEKKYRIHRLEVPLYRYRRHDRNLTSDKARMVHYGKKLAAKHGIHLGV